MSATATTSAASGAEARRRELWIGIGCAALVLLIWSSFLMLSRFGMRADFAPTDLLALRVGISGLIVLPFYLRQRTGRVPPGRGIILALGAGVGFGGLSFLALSLAPVSHAAALQTGALPLYTAVLAMVVLGERFAGTKLAGLALILLGVALAAYDSVSFGAPGQWYGDIAYSAASIAWASYTVLAQRWRVKPLPAVTAVYIWSAILYLPIYIIFCEPRLLTAPILPLISQMLLQGVLATVISLLLFMRVLQSLGGTSATMLTAATPSFVTLVSIPLLGEQPSLLAWISIGCVTLGIVATILSLQPQRGSH